MPPGKRDLTGALKSIPPGEFKMGSLTVFEFRKGVLIVSELGHGAVLTKEFSMKSEFVVCKERFLIFIAPENKDVLTD